MRVRLTAPLLTAILGLSLSACGGSQTPIDPPPTPVVTEQPPARVAPVVPAGPTLNHHVYWDGIHVMTVYEVPGIVRSEVRGDATPPYGERNAHFSLISHYFESEGRWSMAIENATSVDDLLVRLGRIELVQLDTVEVEPQEF
ncbi:MAG: hypothetical protein ACI81R_003462 [Bradymonadia bacterium]|jgi:hypothetical protein